MGGLDCIGALSVGRPSSLLAALAAGCFATLVTVMTYRRSPLIGLKRGLAVLLKLGCFYSLLLCLIDLQWVTSIPKERANTVAILLDDSLSMNLPDARVGITRGARLVEEWAKGAVSWRSDLERDFKVRSFAFSSSLRELTRSSDVGFRGSPTALRASMDEATSRLDGDLAAIVLLTDGVVSESQVPEGASLSPVYPVLFGRDVAEADLGLGSVGTTISAFEDSPVTVSAEVRLEGGRPAVARVRLEAVDPPPVEVGSGILSEASLPLSPAQPRGVVQLQFTPVRSGPTFYKISVDSPEMKSEEELTLENNKRFVCVNRAKGPHKVLYVAGRPNWEFGPLRRALESDAEVELRGLIRIAKREPKFTFKGRAGESSNPLFRGFQSGENAELQRYDKPVLVRVNVDSGDELSGGFPKTAEELFTYKAIILDDVESEFFSPEQLRLVQRFVADRGGGLLMLGGMESFEGGGWRGTPIEPVLPVWLGKVPPGETDRGPQHWALTREGLVESWVRRRKSEAEELSRLARLPALDIVNHVDGIKPAATVLAVAASDTLRAPALVTQRYGVGRCGALLAGDLFQWGMGEPTQVSDLMKQWRQMTRWLVADVPSKVDLSADWSASTQSAKLTIRVRDAAALPVEDADMEVRIRKLGDPEAAAMTIRPEPNSEPGLYTVAFDSETSGLFVAEARVKDAKGQPLGDSTVGWVQYSSEMEFSVLTSGRPAMEALAKRTGGEVIPIEDLDGLVNRLRKIPKLTMETRVQPLWHTPSVFVFALICLCAEWFLRRRNGAA